MTNPITKYGTAGIVFLTVLTVLLLVAITSCVDSKKRGIGVVRDKPGETVETGIFLTKYGRSILIAVGIDAYQKEDRLRFAVKDASGFSELLASLGFTTIALFDRDATKQNVMGLLRSELQKADENDRIVFFFAGHGIDLPAANGATKGYLVPVDGNVGDKKTLIPLDWFQMDLLADKQKSAKHILYIFDACSSGIIATRSFIQVDENLKNYIAELLKRRARQVITAGTANQQVLDGGYEGHSIFTGLIIQGIEKNWADINKDYHITAMELGLYLSQEVFTRSNGAQKPDFAKLIGTEGGDVVLKFPTLEEQARLDSQTKPYPQSMGGLLLHLEPPACKVSVFDIDDNHVLTRKVLNGILSISDLTPGDYQILIQAEDNKYSPVKILTGIYENITKDVVLPQKIDRLRIPATL